jgi:hypothetical protein
VGRRSIGLRIESSGKSSKKAQEGSKGSRKVQERFKRFKKVQRFKMQLILI